MKILDATTVIAFLSEMKCPEGLLTLSKHCKIIIPKAVANEIKKEPGRGFLLDLKQRSAVKIMSVDQEKVSKVLNEHPHLGKGELEAVILAQSYADKNPYIVSDDRDARNIFHTLDFKWTQELLEIMKERKMIDDHTYNHKKRSLEDSSFYFKSDTLHADRA